MGEIPSAGCNSESEADEPEIEPIPEIPKSKPLPIRVKSPITFIIAVIALSAFGLIVIALYSFGVLGPNQEYEMEISAQLKHALIQYEKQMLLDKMSGNDAPIVDSHYGSNLQARQSLMGQNNLLT